MKQFPQCGREQYFSSEQTTLSQSRTRASKISEILGRTSCNVLVLMEVLSTIY